MDVVKGKWKRSMLKNAWQRCKSLGTSGSKKPQVDCISLKKSKSWHSTTTATQENNNNNSNIKRKHKRQVAQDGCFSVYVGPEKQRFVVKTEFANHPLFQTLLEDAESEYGFSSEGPILLPCDVDLFYKVLAEMDSGDEIRSPVSCSSLVPFSPSRLSSSSSSYYGSSKGYGAYRLFSPSRMLKLNHL